MGSRMWWFWAITIYLGFPGQPISGKVFKEAHDYDREPTNRKSHDLVIESKSMHRHLYRNRKPNVPDGKTSCSDESKYSMDRATLQNCNRAANMLTCKTIPCEIPSGISHVEVTARDQPIYISDHQFVDPSWIPVEALTIQGFGFNMSKANQFFGLGNLSYQILNSSDIGYFNQWCFTGLNKLTSLTLVGMLEFDGSSLQRALLDETVLPKLKLFAVRPDRTYKPPFMRIESNTVDILVSKQLQSINISNTIVEVKTQDFVKFFVGSPSLTEANCSGSFLIFDNSISSIYEDPLNAAFQRPLLNTLDVSNSRLTVIHSSSYSDMDKHDLDNYNTPVPSHIISYIFLLAEAWYCNNIYTDPSEFHGIQNYSSHKVLLKKFVFTRNNVPILNATVILPHDNILRHMDLSNNRLDYIGQGVFLTMTALKELNLSNNRLWNMEQTPEFATLFTSLKSLTVLNLANNALSVIPHSLFISNRHLKILILSNNKLNSVSFELGYLSRLLTLDLRDNRIQFLGNNGMDNVEMIFQGRHGKMNILFEGNPIECSCDSKRFVSLLVTFRNVSKEQLHCNYEGDIIAIESDAIRKCDYLCKRVMITSLSVACSLVCLAVFTSIFVKLRHAKKRKKKRNVEWQLRESVREGNFVCFTAIAGNDDMLVDKVLLRNLRLLLQAKVGINSDVVCTGNRFRPGFSICEEAHRLLTKCRVFVAVISESFMDSQYCRLELREACRQDKPTILIFLGRVETEDMPQYMQDVFRRNSRAWIKQNDEGYYYLVPNIRDTADAIWDLAVTEF